MNITIVLVLFLSKELAMGFLRRVILLNVNTEYFYKTQKEQVSNSKILNWYAPGYLTDGKSEGLNE